jgi:hypothetical protein
MPYESTGDFLLNATPEELKRMDEIMKSIKPYEPIELTNRTNLYWSSILNIKRSFKQLSTTLASNSFVIDSRIDNTKYRNTKPNES